MGNKSSNPNLHTYAPKYNFNQYGFKPEEGMALEKYFNEATGKDRQLNHREFQRIYLQLNPETNTSELTRIADKAFSCADINKDNYISFDEFLAFYILHKSTSENVARNMENFLKNSNDNRTYITPVQAEYMAQFAHKYHGSSTNYSSPVKTFTDKFGNQIPISNFVDEVFVYYYH
jgi:hypothetical protein